jgi:hypothetical protein
MMKELTDLELCQRIAEIEGYKTSVTDRAKGVWASWYKNNCYGWFNPLTDDALCQQLIKKHSISMIKDGDDWWAMVVEDVNLDWSLNFKCLTSNHDYNRAALLCIIEVHKC